MGVDCGDTVELVMRIIKHYATLRRYRVVFIDTVMVREFIRRLNCNHRRGLVARISHALACIAVRYGGFFTVNGNNLWIDLPIRAITETPETELLRVVHECTKRKTWLELKKEKDMQ